MMKALFKQIAIALLAILLCISMIACNTPTGPNDNSKTDATTDGNADTTLGDPVTFVGIDINPSIEMTLDANGLVVSVYGANEDGVILLYGEEDALLGKSYEEAVEKITELAAELGYMEQGHEILASVTGENTAAAEEILQKIDAKISAEAEALGISVTVSSDVAYAILRDLEALKADYPDNTAIQGLTPQKYKLVLAATESGELEVTAAAEMSNGALIEKINEVHATVEKYATDLYRAAKARAEMTFELAMGIALDGVYNTVYLERLQSILSHPEYRNTFYYGAVYQAYQTTARTYEALEQILEFGEEMTNYELDEATAAAIAEELGLADTTPLQNGEGKVTLGSTVKFVEDFLSRNELSAEVRAEIEEMLQAAKDAASLIALSSDAYAADLNALKLQIETVVATVNTTATPLLPLLPADAKADFEACLADLNASVESIATMMADGLTAEELHALRTDAESRAEAMLEKIKSDLSAEELEQAEALKAQAKAEIDRLTAEFSERLTAAENAAKAEIERRREERKNQAK